MGKIGEIIRPRVNLQDVKDLLNDRFAYSITGCQIKSKKL